MRFQLDERDGPCEMLRSEVALLKARMAVCEIKNHRWRVSGIFAARRPHRCPKTQVTCVKRKHIEEIAEFGSADESQHLVDGQIGDVQAISELIVRLDREKTKCRIIGPIEPCPLAVTTYLRSEKPRLAKQPLDAVALSCQDMLICLRAASNTFGCIVKNVEIF